MNRQFYIWNLYLFGFDNKNSLQRQLNTKPRHQLNLKFLFTLKCYDYQRKQTNKKTQEILKCWFLFYHSIPEFSEAP